MRAFTGSNRCAALAAALLAASALSACAGARVGPASFSPDAQLPRPPVVLVQPFAVDPDDVVKDTLGPQFVTGSGSTSERVAEGRKVASAFADKLVAKLRQRGIPAERAGYGAEPPVGAAIVKGQFLSIDQGSRVTRVVIGFGAGAQDVRVRAKVYQLTPHGLLRIDEARGEAYGDKMPGMAVPVGVGAAAGKVVTAAAVSGGMNVVSEITGTMDARLEDLAEKLAERAVAFYVRQGWM